jgi:hypothetical protein
VKKEEVERGKRSYSTSVGRGVDGYRKMELEGAGGRPSQRSDDSPALAGDDWRLATGDWGLATGDWRLARRPTVHSSVACTLNLERNFEQGCNGNAKGVWRGLEFYSRLFIRCSQAGPCSSLQPLASSHGACQAGPRVRNMGEGEGGGLPVHL